MTAFPRGEEPNPAMAPRFPLAERHGDGAGDTDDGHVGVLAIRPGRVA
jgi:hypothetical protein